MRSHALVAVICGGCQFSVEIAPLAGDGSIDAPDSAACTMAWPYAPSNFTPCAGDPISPVLALDDRQHTYDPASGVLRSDGTISATLPSTGSTVRVLSVTGFSLDEGGSLRILGPAPLVIAVYGMATIGGTITVSADRATPGAGAAACAGMKGGDADSLLLKSAGGGGAGGAFGSSGAAGGTGDTSTTPTPGGMLMAAQGEATLVPLRGGCAGGSGGEEHVTAVATPGIGGAGGGAIQISVRDALVLGTAARIESNGGGGRGATNTTNGASTHAGAGGGGGGSGGAILLETAALTFPSSARLCANGGGGGGGSHDGTDGGNGANGTCDVVAAEGGSGNGAAGDGAFGTTNATAGAPGGGADGGGGGGGGGTGRIRVRALSGTQPSGSMSTPPATPG